MEIVKYERCQPTNGDDVGRAGRPPGKSLRVVECVVVTKVLEPELYYQRSARRDPVSDRDGESREDTAEYVKFRDQSRAMFWGKFRRKIDPLHEYSMLCDGIRVVKIVGARRRIPRLQLLLDVSKTLEAQLGNFVQREQRGIDGLQESARNGECGSVLRELGNREWYRRLERHFEDYFREWYFDELGGAYDRQQLAQLGAEQAFELARMAANSPWKLCFWWLFSREIPLVEELELERMNRLAKDFRAAVPEECASAVSAYRGNPFGFARQRGDSCVDFGEFVRAVPDSRHREFQYREKLVATMPLPPRIAAQRSSDPSVRDRVAYAMGDRLCEMQVCDMLRKMTTENTGDPELDDAIVRELGDLTDEQGAVVRGALGQRFYVCDGVPGSGKTSRVIRSIAQAFSKEAIIGVAFTGMAANKLKGVIGVGFTAHRVIGAWRSRLARREFDEKIQANGTRRVLIIEEAQTMHTKLLRMLLLALEGFITRVYVFGDHRQMPPPGEGQQFLKAALDSLSGTPRCGMLKTSMRVTNDGQGAAFCRNLQRICDYNGGSAFGGRFDDPDRPRLELEWQGDPGEEGCPFQFLQRGRTVQATARVIYDALVTYDPNCLRRPGGYQILVHTNEARQKLCEEWNRLVDRNRDRGLAGFKIGDGIMFLKNDYGHKPFCSEFCQDPVMNGTMGTIDQIFDENVGQPERIVEPKRCTGEPQKPGHWVRWIHVRSPADVLVQITTYGIENLARQQPATIAKMQGQEADVAVICIDPVDDQCGTRFTRREMYTACQRGRKKCMIVGGGAIPDGKRPRQSVPREDDRGQRWLGPCPDPDFEKIVQG